MTSMAGTTFSPFLPVVHHLCIPLFFFLFPLYCTPSSSSAAQISYSDHCGSIVPESIPTKPFVDTSFTIRDGYFSGGKNLFRSSHRYSASSPYFEFQSYNLQKTRSPGILQLQATLVLYANQPRISSLFFGFWSESIGKLCMLTYRKTSNISTSLATGTVDSLDPLNSRNYFEPILLLAYVQKKYEFTMIPQVCSSCPLLNVEEESLSLDPSSSCSFLSNIRSLIVNNTTSCFGRKCATLGRSLRLSPVFIHFKEIKCIEYGRLHMHIGFSNVSNYENTLSLENSFVGEGYWDQNKNQLCLILCRVLKGDLQSSYSVGECSMGLSLWFSTTATLTRRRNIIGRIWSNKDKDDPDYFSMSSFQDLEGVWDIISDLKFKYTHTDSVQKSCTLSNRTILQHKKYLHREYFGIMYFPMTLRDAGGKKHQGRANILSRGETYLGVEGTKSSFAATLAGLRIGKEVIWNVSYVIKYAPSLEYSNEVVTVIVAEGIYNTEAGTLCMRGCRYPSLPFVEGYMTTLESDPIDCEIIINIDLKALNQKVGEQKLQNSGTISSTRNKLDSLYFDPIQISSGNSYVQETMQFSWRIDAETMTVLISLTFSCICIHLQILQFKKHSGAIPSVSITMLVVLMLGYMMPLVLNLETLSTRHPFSEWPEVNQVAARVMNIVASFLCFRLLQVA
ncbi:hypothetical protein Cni_G05939 [Canna indica]|uniref:RING-type E3 ubiquitin transferase n=1 Tax=Canna indica TaxID=4628 RepID=A0AAQ3JW23_9LILI|nr:hypothetical protein Cni_G05939 [Canna indica]